MGCAHPATRRGPRIREIGESGGENGETRGGGGVGTTEERSAISMSACYY